MKSSNILQVLAILALTGQCCHSSKILFLLPLASRSHVHVFEPLMRALAERGHDIVNLSPIVTKDLPPTVKQIQLITLDDLLGNMPSPFELRKHSILAAMFNNSSWEHITKACEKTLQNPKLHDLMKTEKFDLVIVDIFLNYCVLGAIPHFNTSSIFVATMAAPPTISNVIGNRLPSSFVPSILLQYADKMTFKERLINTVSEFLAAIMWDTMIIKRSEGMYREHLPNGKDLPGIDEIQANVSMIFSNSHFTLTYPRPLLPDSIEVGGMHTRPVKKLPKDLDEFLGGSSEDGFIFFSLGSVVKPKEMPESTRKVFIKVFSKLKQRVLWKWDGEMMPDLPKNVKLAKWLPQQDILGHPKIKLFMSHGGLLSTQESVYHGVPVLGLPLFGDQDLNIRKAETSGFAKFVEILDLSEEALEEALHELLNNPSYALKVKEISKLVRDLPETALDKAVYWTEYVLRHKGAPHLRSAARDLNFFQYYVLDVVAALIAIVLIVFFIVVRCCKAACRCMCGKGSKVKKE